MTKKNIVKESILLAETANTRFMIDAVVIRTGTHYVTTGTYVPAIVVKPGAKVKVARNAAVGRIVANDLNQIDVKRGGVVWWVANAKGEKLSGGIGF